MHSKKRLHNHSVSFGGSLLPSHNASTEDFSLDQAVAYITGGKAPRLKQATNAQRPQTSASFGHRRLKSVQTSLNSATFQVVAQEEEGDMQRINLMSQNASQQNLSQIDPQHASNIASLFRKIFVNRQKVNATVVDIE